jgi:hypothetical protein
VEINKLIGALSMSLLVLGFVVLPPVARAAPVAWAVDAPYMKKPISGSFQFHVEPDLIEEFHSDSVNGGIVERFINAIGRSSLLVTMALNVRGRLSIQNLPITFTVPAPGFPAGGQGEPRDNSRGESGAAVPLPAKLALLGLGLTGLVVCRRKSIRQV